MDTQKKIIFDMKEWLKIDGDSGPFIQYAVARCRSILRKAEELSPQTQSSSELSQLREESELQLLARLATFGTTVRNAAIQEKPHLLTHYLYDVAKRFHSFYHDCPILTAPAPELMDDRLNLCRMVEKILVTGLDLCGIPAPEKM